MPRQLRHEYPGSLYHVMNRGDLCRGALKANSYQLNFVSIVETDTCMTQRLEKALPVLVIADNVLTLIAAIDDVINRAWIFMAKLARQCPHIARSRAQRSNHLFK